MAAVLQWLPEHVAPQKDIEWLQEVRCALEADWNDKKQGSTTEALESSIAFLPHVTRWPFAARQQHPDVRSFLFI